MKRSYTEYLEYSRIEGYRIEIEVFLTGIDAMPLVGLTMTEE